MADLLCLRLAAVIQKLPESAGHTEDDNLGQSATGGSDDPDTAAVGESVPAAVVEVPSGAVEVQLQTRNRSSAVSDVGTGVSCVQSPGNSSM